MSTNYVVTLDKCIEFVTLAGVFSTEGLARQCVSDVQAIQRKSGFTVHGYLIFKMKVNEPGIPKWHIHIDANGTDVTPGVKEDPGLAAAAGI